MAQAGSTTAIPLEARQPRPGALSHIPGDLGWPVVGNTLKLLADPRAFVERRAKRLGHVYRNSAFGQVNVTLLGPQANEFVLLDQGRFLSSALGWDVIIGRLFPRGLLLRDDEDHRQHRKALSVAFKAGPMRSYLAELDPAIRRRVAEWGAGSGTVLVYPAMKQLTLDLAATSFLGGGLGAASASVKQALVNMLTAAVAVVRKPLPGTAMRRGVQGREYLTAFFARQITSRRQGGGEDLFSHLCRATHEDGAPLSVGDIVDHMAFIMAAHDTLTSALTSLVWLLAVNPDWQDTLREEVAALGLRPGEPLRYDQLDAMPLTEMRSRRRCGSTRPCPPSRGARRRRSSSAATPSRPARTSASTRCSRTTCPTSGRSRHASTRCAFRPMPSASGTVSRGCRSAAGRTCASACTSRTCRRSASSATCWARPCCRSRTGIALGGRCDRYRARGTGCRSGCGRSPERAAAAAYMVAPITQGANSASPAP